MFNFVYYVKSIATILITNSHYGEIWPSSAMAVGGLLGNVLFFAISGFCLFEVKGGFLKWYGKRFLRIYPIMLAYTLFTVLIGSYPIKNWADAFRLFVYPTNYIFFVWIMILYVAFYLVGWLAKKHTRIVEISLACIVVVWLTVYLIFIDKSYYSVDEVYKPFILFIYFACMLVGALFRKKLDLYQKVKPLNVALLIISLVCYFATKLIISKFSSLFPLQILNQMILVVCVCFIFAVFISLEKYFKRLPPPFTKTAKCLSNITLHIYLVQFLIIYKFQDLIFPLNFLVVTALILFSASALYFIEKLIAKLICTLLSKIKKENSDARN